MLVYTSCSKNQSPAGSTNTNNPPPAASPTIWEKLAKDENEFPVCSILFAAIRRAGLDSLLDSRGPFTLFAPYDIGFKGEGITRDLIDALPIDSVKKIVLRLIVPDSILPKLFYGQRNKIVSLSGDSVFVSINPDLISVNNILSPQTVFLSNGLMIYLYSMPLYPVRTITQLAQSEPELAFFSAALQRAKSGVTNIESMLSGQIVCTVFAPSNQAFRNAGYTSIADINAANPDTLASLLSYHVLPGRMFYSDLISSKNLVQYITVSGKSLTIVTEEVTNGFDYDYVAKVLGNANPENAIILQKDNMATNGIIHMINKVLLR
jgi:uncharacterized surface protein with fasciclin (FAS1) repeats